LIIVVCGLPGTGKTTLAKNLASLMGAVILSTDKIRKEIIANPTYTVQEIKLVYRILLLLAKYLHNAGVNCILDGTFSTENQRKAVKKDLSLSQTQFYIVECICPQDVTISRLKKRRGDYSDADFSVYMKKKKMYQPVEEEHFIADTTKPQNITAKYIANQILKNKKDSKNGQKRKEGGGGGGEAS
jgi:predicted kinase